MTVSNRTLVRLADVEREVERLQERQEQILQELKSLSRQLINVGNAGVRLADVADGYTPGVVKGTVVK